MASALTEPDAPCPAGILRGGPTRDELLRMLTAAELVRWHGQFGDYPPGRYRDAVTAVVANVDRESGRRGIARERAA